MDLVNSRILAYKVLGIKNMYENKFTKKRFITEDGFILKGNIINFLKYRYIAYIMSLLLVLSSIIIISVKGLNLGLDFTGGTVADIQINKQITASDLKVIIEKKFPGIDVSTASSTSGTSYIIRIPSALSNNKLGDNLSNYLKDNIKSDITIKSIEFVGPKVGKELTEAGIYSIIATIVMLLIYISFRFQWKLSFGAILALIHDSTITIGIFALLGINIDLNFIAAILSVVGYSINDTIIVYDRMRENIRKSRFTIVSETINISLTQTWSRTIVTSFTTLIVVISLLLFGGPSLYSFSLALFIGILVGTYSSLYIAAAISYEMKLSKEEMIIKKSNKEQLSNENDIYIE